MEMVRSLLFDNCWVFLATGCCHCCYKGYLRIDPTAGDGIYTTSADDDSNVTDTVTPNNTTATPKTTTEHLTQTSVAPSVTEAFVGVSTTLPASTENDSKFYSAFSTYDCIYAHYKNML